MTTAVDIDTLTIVEEGDALKAFKDFLTYQKNKGKGKVNPKKLESFARRLGAKCAPHIVNGLIRNVLSIKNPVQYLEECFEELGQYAVIIKDLVESGNHGMLLVGKDIIPIQLKCPESWLTDGEKWIEDDEKEIQLQAAQNWMKDEDIGELECRVVLFPSAGFSGIPREVHLRCVKDTNGLRKYPGRNWFY